MSNQPLVGGGDGDDDDDDDDDEPVEGKAYYMWLSENQPNSHL